MDDDRPYWNMKIEPLLGTREIKEIQLHNLKEHLKFLYENSRVMRDYFKKANVTPESIGSVRDLQSAFPPITKDELRNLLFTYMGDGGIKGAFSSLLSVPLEDVVLVCTTSGTTGEPTPYLFTKRDLEIQNESFSRAFWRTGMRPGGIVIHAMALSMFGAGIPLVQSIQQFGCTVIPVGAEGGTERVLNYIRFIGPIFGIDAIFMTPSFAEYIIEKSPQITGVGADRFGIKRVMCGGEPGAGIGDVKRRIEEGFSAKVFDMMGLGPIAFSSCDYPEYQGMHFLTEDTTLLELVDPESREPVEIEDGAVGVAVFTPLKGDCLNVIRHYSADVMEVFTSPCPCGKSGIRVKVIGRTDDMLKVKGVMVYPAAIEGVLSSFGKELTGEFRIILDEPPPKVTPPLKLKVEHFKCIEGERLNQLASEIAQRMHNRLRIRPQIEWVLEGTLERSVHKKSYFERRYE